MRANGRIILEMGRANINLKMEASTKGIGSMDRKMDMEDMSMPLEMSMKANLEPV